MKRREFITLVGGAAAAWPIVVRAQQAAMPVIGYLGSGSADNNPHYLAAFRDGLDETGITEGRDFTVEYRWANGHYDRLPELAADLVHRKVAVIVAPTTRPAALAAKAATTTIPIIFSVGEDPVQLGLVASYARPGGNATGINFINSEVEAKRLGLLHEFVPKAVRLAVLVNPGNARSAEPAWRDVEDAALKLGLRVQVLDASTIGEIDSAFATFAQDRPDALFISGDSFFNSRRTQLATLTARERIPAAYASRDYVAAGGLLSYGTDLMDMYRQVGIYTGRILKGDRPNDLPVVQSTKFEFVINLQTARALDIEVPPGVLASADEVIE